MRVPLMPLAMSLAVGGLLYAAYRGNERIADAAAARPAVATSAAATANRAATDPASPVKTPRDAEVDAGNALAMQTPVEAQDDETPDIAELGERCTAIAAAATAACDARYADEPYDEFIRRPVVAFVDDPALRRELERVARNVYEGPSASAASARHEALLDARCAAARPTGPLPGAEK
jgi:hypothetical protein